LPARTSCPWLEVAWRACRSLAGLLSNFAAGIFLMALMPFKVGDIIQGGGLVGTVRETGLFVTAIDTPDNVRTFVGNGKLFSDTIQNFTAIPNVASDPAPSIEILTFNPMGTVIAVRPICHNDHYWQVYFDTNKAIAEAGYPAPETRHLVRNS
jgi:small conductance mechanosensitive channel